MADQLNDGDVETVSKRGQWVNRVIGGEELSESFSTKEEAMDAGQSLATELGSRHVVRESDPTGVITDEDPAAAAADEPEPPPIV